MPLSGNDKSALDNSGLNDPVINHGGTNRNYDAEMAEFAKMQDSIKDIDWYKADAQAARNGQEAAMNQAAAWKLQYSTLKDSVSPLEKNYNHMRIYALVLQFIGIPLAFLLGGWLF